MVDLRYESIYGRLSKLTIEQLTRIMESDNLCLDSYNYNSSEGTFCPMAMAFGLKEEIEEKGLEPSQELVLDMIKKKCKTQGIEFGTVKGIEGNFYKYNREKDIKELCWKIIQERKEGNPTLLL
jgi:hypothetical protein